MVKSDNTLVLLLVLILICAVSFLILKRSTYEMFAVNVNSVVVIKTLNVPQTYKQGSPDEKNPEAQNSKIKDDIDNFQNIMNNLYKSGDNVTYLNILNRYAQQNGLLGKGLTEQGFMEGALLYCYLLSRFLIIRKRTKNYNANNMRVIVAWFNKMYAMYGNFHMGRPNNQYILSIMCNLLNCCLNNKIRDGSKYTSMLITFINNSIKNGYITTETNRKSRVLIYHYYFMGFAFSTLGLAKLAKIPTNFNKVKSNITSVVNRLSDPNVVTKFTQQFGTQSTNTRSNYAAINNYLFNNGPIPKSFTTTAMEVQLDDLIAAF